MRRSLLLVGVCLGLLFGCEKKPKIDYSPLDQAGMWSSNVDELKKLKVTDAEVAQITKLKQAGASDELCMALFNGARSHNHDFSNADSAINLSRAGYSEAEILEMAQSDQIDVLSVEAITLKLIGLSNSTVHQILQLRIQGQPTLTSEQIGRLKNTGMTEKQIVEMISQGITGSKADALIAQREATRNHSNTGFVKVRGRKPH